MSRNQLRRITALSADMSCNDPEQNIQGYLYESNPTSSTAVKSRDQNKNISDG